MSSVLFPGDEPAKLIAKLEALTRDIGRIHSGILPSAADLVAAPLLHGWAPAIRETLCLAGSVHAHPLVRGGPITTSEVYAIDLVHGWARTYSRFYVLGARYDEQDVRHG
jgi:hypothetical protein